MRRFFNLPEPSRKTESQSRASKTTRSKPSSKHEDRNSSHPRREESKGYRSNSCVQQDLPQETLVQSSSRSQPESRGQHATSSRARRLHSHASVHDTNESSRSGEHDYRSDRLVHLRQDRRQASGQESRRGAESESDNSRTHGARNLASFGAAAEFYGDQGQSVLTQPGVRPNTPNIDGTQTRLMSALPTTKPPSETGHVVAQDYATDAQVEVMSSLTEAQDGILEQAWVDASSSVSSSASSIVSARSSRSSEGGGPLRRISQWWNNYDDVRRMEDYMEYIGVCRYCFDSPSNRKHPRRHLHRQSSQELRNRTRIDKHRRPRSSSSSSSLDLLARKHKAHVHQQSTRPEADLAEERAFQDMPHKRRRRRSPMTAEKAVQGLSTAAALLTTVKPRQRHIKQLDSLHKDYWQDISTSSSSHNSPVHFENEDHSLEDDIVLMPSRDDESKAISFQPLHDAAILHSPLKMIDPVPFDEVAAVKSPEISLRDVSPSRFDQMEATQIRPTGKKLSFIESEQVGSNVESTPIETARDFIDPATEIREVTQRSTQEPVSDEDIFDPDFFSKPSAAQFETLDRTREDDFADFLTRYGPAKITDTDINTAEVNSVDAVSDYDFEKDDAGDRVIYMYGMRVPRLVIIPPTPPPEVNESSEADNSRSPKEPVPNENKAAEQEEPADTPTTKSKPRRSLRDIIGSSFISSVAKGQTGSPTVTATGEATPNISESSTPDVHAGMQPGKHADVDASPKQAGVTFSDSLPEVPASKSKKSRKGRKQKWQMVDIVEEESAEQMEGLVNENQHTETRGMASPSKAPKSSISNSTIDRTVFETSSPLPVLEEHDSPLQGVKEAILEDLPIQSIDRDASVREIAETFYDTTETAFELPLAADENVPTATSVTTGAEVTLTPEKSTAVPLRFRTPLVSPNTPSPHASVEPFSPTRESGRRSRPSSTEFKISSEWRPLYLVEKNSRMADLEEQLPSLPPSQASSVLEEDVSEEFDLTHDSRFVEETDDTEILGSGQTTPRAASFADRDTPPTFALPGLVLGTNSNTDGDFLFDSELGRDGERRSTSFDHRAPLPKHDSLVSMEDYVSQASTGRVPVETISGADYVLPAEPEPMPTRAAVVQSGSRQAADLIAAEAEDMLRTTILLESPPEQLKKDTQNGPDFQGLFDKSQSWQGDIENDTIPDAVLTIHSSSTAKREADEKKPPALQESKPTLAEKLVTFPEAAAVLGRSRQKSKKHRKGVQSSASPQDATIPRHVQSDEMIDSVIETADEQKEPDLEVQRRGDEQEELSRTALFESHSQLIADTGDRNSELLGQIQTSTETTNISKHEPSDFSPRDKFHAGLIEVPLQIAEESDQTKDSAGLQHGSVSKQDLELALSSRKNKKTARKEKKGKKQKFGVPLDADAFASVDNPKPLQELEVSGTEEQLYEPTAQSEAERFSSPLHDIATTDDHAHASNNVEPLTLHGARSAFPGEALSTRESVLVSATTGSTDNDAEFIEVIAPKVTTMQPGEFEPSLTMKSETANSLIHSPATTRTNEGRETTQEFRTEANSVLMTDLSYKEDRVGSSEHLDLQHDDGAVKGTTISDESIPGAPDLSTEGPATVAAPDSIANENPDDDPNWFIGPKSKKKKNQAKKSNKKGKAKPTIRPEVPQTGHPSDSALSNSRLIDTAGHRDLSLEASQPVNVEPNHPADQEEESSLLVSSVFAHQGHRALQSPVTGNVPEQILADNLEVDSVRKGTNNVAKSTDYTLSTSEKMRERATSQPQSPLGDDILLQTDISPGLRDDTSAPAVFEDGESKFLATDDAPNPFGISGGNSKQYRLAKDIYNTSNHPYTSTSASSNLDPITLASEPTVENDDFSSKTAEQKTKIDDGFELSLQRGLQEAGFDSSLSDTTANFHSGVQARDSEVDFVGARKIHATDATTARVIDDNFDAVLVQSLQEAGFASVLQSSPNESPVSRFSLTRVVADEEGLQSDSKTARRLSSTMGTEEVHDESESGPSHSGPSTLTIRRAVEAKIPEARVQGLTQMTRSEDSEPSEPGSPLDHTVRHLLGRDSGVRSPPVDRVNPAIAQSRSSPKRFSEDPASSNRAWDSEDDFDAMHALRTLDHEHTISAANTTVAEEVYPSFGRSRPASRAAARSRGQSSHLSSEVDYDQQPSMSDFANAGNSVQSRKLYSPTSTQPLNYDPLRGIGKDRFGGSDLSRSQLSSTRSIGGPSAHHPSDVVAVPQMDHHDLLDQLRVQEDELREKDAEITNIKSSLTAIRDEVARLSEHNARLLIDRQRRDSSELMRLQYERDTAQEELHAAVGEQRNLKLKHEPLFTTASPKTSPDKPELERLRKELAETKARLASLQEDIFASRDDNYFTIACRELCQHVQQWILRFSKHSDRRVCRALQDIKDERIEGRLDNAILDGANVDFYLRHRILRRDVFMSVVMTLIWEFVFTRYLFGMDREQRQRLKALEKTLGEVGPKRAVSLWRSTTLTLLSQRPIFATQRDRDSEAVVQEIYETLTAVLPPPHAVANQLQYSLRKIVREAVDLSIEMRMQRAEYMMLPPLRPEYDANGDLRTMVHYNPSLMDSREDSPGDYATVRLVLFPLVVKKGNEFGEGDREVVISRAQVLTTRDEGRSRVGTSFDNRSQASLMPEMDTMV